MLQSPDPHIDALCRRTGIRLLVLFGSRASGRPRAGSDTDVAVLLDRSPTIAELAALGEQLEQALHMGGEVHPVVLNDLESTTLGREIVRGGRVLYDCDAQQWPAFVARAMKAYADFEPFRRLRRKVLRGEPAR